jgi:hypothetical protein
VDEVFDLSRSVRDDRYLYIRNYMPHYSWMPPERFSDQALMRREMQQWLEADRLDAVQLTYAAPRRVYEELYDTWSDPHQVRDLSSSRPHQSVLQRLRKTLDDWMLETRDVGFLAEANVWKRLRNDTPWDVAHDDGRYPIRRILQAASLVGAPAASSQAVSHLDDADAAVRYWAAVALTATGPPSAMAQDALRHALRDAEPSVRVQAATALATHGDHQQALPVLEAELRSSRPEVVLQAVRALQLMKQAALPARPAIQAALDRARQSETAAGHPCWMFVRFSAEAALEALSD